ncbi:MAG: hypothetical protein C0600_13225 [Ignavibacteria bacterium]|nr:MAG: hypothetical protein C0600_13225 [Ignavibacteria bacterium]
MTDSRKLFGIAACTVLYLVLIAGAVHAQEEQPERPQFWLHTTQNEQFRGYVVSRSADTLHFRTTGGIAFAIHVAQVEELRPVSPGADSTAVIGEEAWRVAERALLLNRPARSLFAMPTAYPFDAGEVHLGLYELFFASGTVGIAGYVDLSLGTFVLPGTFFDPYLFGIKVSPVHGEQGALAIGAGLGSYDDDSPVMLYGMGTLALGPVWLTAGYTSSEDGKAEILMFGADLPISRRTRLMAEVWAPSEMDGVMMCFGARVETEFMYIDVGMYFPTQQGGRYLIYLPWLGGTFLL